MKSIRCYVGWSILFVVLFAWSGGTQTSTITGTISTAAGNGTHGPS